MKQLLFFSISFFLIVSALPGYAEKVTIPHLSVSAFTIENQPQASIEKQEGIIDSYFESDADLLKETNLFPRYKIIIKHIDRCTETMATRPAVLKVLLRTPSFSYISQSLVLIFPHHYFW